MDPWKREEFLPLLRFYEAELARLGVEVRLGEEGGREEGGVWAVPEERQPAFTPYSGKTVLVDSNLYAYQDYAFKWAEENKVVVTERGGLEGGLDRTRGYLLAEAYRKRGVEVVKDWRDAEAEADVVIREFSRRQPSIGSAIWRGGTGWRPSTSRDAQGLFNP